MINEQVEEALEFNQLDEDLKAIESKKSVSPNRATGMNSSVEKFEFIEDLPEVCPTKIKNFESLVIIRLSLWHDYSNMSKVLLYVCLLCCYAKSNYY